MAKKKAAPSTDLVPVEVKAELAAEREKQQAGLAIIQALPLETQEDMDQHGALIAGCKARITELEKQRKSVTDSLNQVVRDINSWFKPVREVYEAAERALKDKVSAYLLAQDARTDAALKTIEAGAGEAPAEAFEALTGQVERAPNLSTREEWVWYQTKPLEIPDEYFKRILDTDKIDEIVSRDKDKTSIPGIAVERKLVVIGRQR